jgi:hypothetical protein
MPTQSTAAHAADMDVTTLFDEAMAAIKGNRMDEAKDLLLRLVRVNPEHEQGWFWLASVVTEVPQTIECIRRVLALNPDNSVARDWLAVSLQADADGGAAAKDAKEADRPVQKIGAYLVSHGFVTSKRIDEALRAQAEAERVGQRKRIGELLIQQGAINANQLRIALAEQEQDFFSLFWD